MEPQTSDRTGPIDPLDDGRAPNAAAADFTPPENHALDEVADTYLRDSVEAQKLYDQAVAEAERGNENEAVVHFLRASKLAEAAHEWYLAAVACHRVGDVYRSPGAPYDLPRAVRMYHRAVAAYQRCGLFAEARELAYRVACLRLWRAAELELAWRERIELFVYWALAGLGYRPLRVLVAAAVAVFCYAILYWSFGGLAIPGGGSGPGDFASALYFSGITFSTVGFGDLLPAPHVRLLAMSEGMLGFITVSFFVVVLANRLRH